MVALTVENLLQQFINLKQTGRDVPGQCSVFLFVRSTYQIYQIY